MVAPIPVTDPRSEAEIRSRIIAIRARQQATAEASALKLAQIKARKDAAARPLLTAAAEATLRKIEERAKQTAEDRPALQKEVAVRDPRRILARISAGFGVPLSEIDGPSRKAAVIRARFAAIYALREANPHYSLNRIGQYVGGRDHSSVGNALRKMQQHGVPQPDGTIRALADIAQGPSA